MTPDLNPDDIESGEEGELDRAGTGQSERGRLVLAVVLACTLVVALVVGVVVTVRYVGDDETASSGSQVDATLSDEL